MQINDTIALGKLRFRLDNPMEQIDNGRSYAGSPMYFYCKMCGYQSDVKPESYSDRPNRHCGPCQGLITSNPGITPASIVEMAKGLPDEAKPAS